MSVGYTYHCQEPPRLNNLNENLYIAKIISLYMIKQYEARDSLAIKKKGDEVRGYESHEKNHFLVEEDVIGIDANVLVDLVESPAFREEIRQFVMFNFLSIHTVNIALWEARQVLVSKRKYTPEKAIESLNGILKEFGISKIDANPEYNSEAKRWVDLTKKNMYLKKIGTFYNDCRILINLIKQAKVNLYITEDRDLAKAVKKLRIPVRVKIIGEASNLNQEKIKDFFKEKNKAYHKKNKRR